MTKRSRVDNIVEYDQYRHLLENRQTINADTLARSSRSNAYCMMNLQKQQQKRYEGTLILIPINTYLLILSYLLLVRHDSC